MAFLSTQHRPSTSAPGDGSRTITIHDSQPDEDSGSGSGVGALKLRGDSTRTGKRVAWGEDVIDNEGYGKKKSKICCIYHKPRKFDESSDEDSSDEDGDEDDDHCTLDHETHPHSHPRIIRHPHRHGMSGEATLRGPGGTETVVHELDSDELNAYEVVPKSKKGKGKQKVMI